MARCFVFYGLRCVFLTEVCHSLAFNQHYRRRKSISAILRRKHQIILRAHERSHERTLPASTNPPLVRVATRGFGSSSFDPHDLGLALGEFLQPAYVEQLHVALRFDLLGAGKQVRTGNSRFREFIASAYPVAHLEDLFSELATYVEYLFAECEFLRVFDHPHFRPGLEVVLEKPLEDSAFES